MIERRKRAPYTYKDIVCFQGDALPPGGGQGSSAFIHEFIFRRNWTVAALLYIVCTV